MTGPDLWEVVIVAGAICGLFGGVLLLWSSRQGLRFLGAVLFPALVPVILISVLLITRLTGAGEAILLGLAALGYFALLPLTIRFVTKTADMPRKARQFDALQSTLRKDKESKQTLPPGTSARFRLPDDDRRHLVVVQGGIADILTSIAHPDVVINSENDFMMLGRPFDKNFSGSLRGLDAEKDASGYITVDAMDDKLSAAFSIPRRPVKLSSVFVTETTGLKRYGVQYVFHVATVRPRASGGGFSTDPDEIPSYIEACFAKYIEVVRAGANVETLLFPLIGAGDGGVSSEQAAKMMAPSIIRQMERYQGIRETYIVAFREGDRQALFEAAGALNLVAD